MKLIGFVIIAAVSFVSGISAMEKDAIPEGPDLPAIHRMRRTPVQSEAITTIGYHRKTRTLEVRFRSGEIYRYADVAVGVYQEFITADSKGRFFRERIRGQYRFWKVSP